MKAEASVNALQFYLSIGMHHHHHHRQFILETQNRTVSENTEKTVCEQ